MTDRQPRTPHRRAATRRAMICAVLAASLLLVCAASAAAKKVRVSGPGYSLGFTLPPGFYLSEPDGQEILNHTHHGYSLDLTLDPRTGTPSSDLRRDKDRDVHRVSLLVWCGLEPGAGGTTPECARAVGFGVVELDFSGAANGYSTRVVVSILKSLTGGFNGNIF